MELIERRFSQLSLSPWHAKELFLLAAFDHTVLRHLVLTLTANHFPAFSPQDLGEMTNVFRQCRARYNLSHGWCLSLTDVYLAAPEMLQALSLEQVLSLQVLTDGDLTLANHLGWAIDNSGVFSDDQLGVWKGCSAAELVKLLKAFPSAPKLVRSVGESLARRLTVLGEAVSSNLCVDLLHTAPKLLQYPGSPPPLPVDLVSWTVQQCLQTRSLSIESVTAIVASFHRMSCFNAVAACLLKYHGMISSCSHNVWRVFTEAALAANIQNENTRRALLKRGSELQSSMTFGELNVFLTMCSRWQLQLKASSHWLAPSELALRVHNLRLQGGYPCSSDVGDLLTLFKTAALEKQVVSCQPVLHALCEAVLHQILELNLEETVVVLKLLVDADIRHPDLCQRIMTTSHVQLSFDAAYWMLRLCGKCRYSPPDTIDAAAECLLKHSQAVSYKEAVDLLRATMECQLRHRGLSRTLIQIAQDAMEVLHPLELYVLAAAVRFHRFDDSTTLESIACRGVQLATNVDVELGSV